MPSPTCEIKNGAGAYVATDNGVDVTPGNTVTIHLVSNAGVKTWTIECVTSDELSDPTAITAALAIDQNAKTATFTAPVAGRAYRFLSTVMDDQNVASTTTFCVYTLVSGARVLAVNEQTEGSSTFGWIKPINALIRSGGGGGGTVPTGTGFTHITAGAQDAAAKLVANADVDAAAAIAGTKIAPDFGAQNVVTTGYLASTGPVYPGAVSFGGLAGAQAASGDIRIDKTHRTVIAVRNWGGTADVPVLEMDSDGVSGNKLFLGTDTTFANQVGALNIYCGGTIGIGISGSTRLYITSSGAGAYQNVNLGVYGGGGSFPSVGGGVGVLAIGNAGTVPTTTPTGGCVIWAEGGAAKVKGGSVGTVTTFGPADPHCPTCGRDFATEHRNDDMDEHFAVCLPCLVDAIKAAGVDTSKFTIHDKRSTTKAQWDDAHAAAKARDAEMTAQRVEAERDAARQAKDAP